MASLAITFGEVHLDNPIVVASCPATETWEGIVECGKAGAGAAISKSISDYDESGLQLGARRARVDARGLWAASTFRRETLTRQAGARLISEAVRRTRMPIIASVAAVDLSIEHWLPTCLDVQNAGASMIQLDLFYLPQPVCTDGSSESLLDLCDNLVDGLSIPVLPKLNIEIPAYLAACRFSNSRVAGLSLLDSVRVPSPIDIAQGGSPVYQFIEEPGMSSVFGSWQLPLTQHYTMILSRLTSLPLCAGGGLTDAKDALELTMLGATLVQYATAVLVNGYGYIRKLVTGLAGLLDGFGYGSILEVRGLALKQQYTDIEEHQPIFGTAVAVVDEARCTGCKSCSQLTFCRALTEREGQISIVHELCDGCGLCASCCEAGAITLQPVPKL